jgi:hypothetical protein
MHSSEPCLIFVVFRERRAEQKNICIGYVNFTSCNVDAGKEHTSMAENSSVDEIPGTGRPIRSSDPVSTARVDVGKEQNLFI